MNIILYKNNNTSFLKKVYINQRAHVALPLQTKNI